ncbi:LytTR family DNA-binding domain-containing protein [Ruegeria sp.]|uniref:LytTR family DNA-binding domain-containing protein n=1 Tax=Ruegeria sp. TaxID=1879320 RepID=UPI00231C783D|nr:LytTR family DNA-binding domain-containing protein [Ruegeria sp.]MDA7964694.1 LytTR family transcriptional regulator [Ruegeria sp.]
MKQQMLQAEFTLVMLPRVSVTLKLHEAFSFFASRNFFLFLAPLMMLLIGATPSLFAMPLDGLGRAVYWVFCLVGYLALAFCMLFFMGATSCYLNFRKFYSPVLCLIAAFGATRFAEFGATEVFNKVFSYTFVYMPLFLPQYLLILGIELIVMLWVLPPFLARARDVSTDADPEPDSSAPSGIVTVNGKTFLIKDIQYIKASQHYVTIRVGEKDVLVRSTFKGILTQLPKDYGFQVHRSFWVSSKGVDIASSLNEPGNVVLTCGTKIAVARSRQCDVRSWLTQLAAAA